MKSKLTWMTRTRGAIHVDYLTPGEYVVLVVLSTYTNAGGRGARPAASRLANDAGVSEKTVRRALQSLVAKGYLVVERQGGGRANPTVYALVWDMPHVPKGGHPDDHVYDDEKPGQPGHPDDHVCENKPGQTETETWSNHDLNLVTAMTTDQVDQVKKSGKNPPTPRKPANLPAVQPNGLRVPRQNRQQALAALNATARSADAERITAAFAASLEGNLDRQTRNEIAQVVDQLLADQIDPRQIAAGLTAWQQSDRLYPSQIPKFVAKAAKPTTPQGVGKPTTKAMNHLAVAERLIAEMENP